MAFVDAEVGVLAVDLEDAPAVAGDQLAVVGVLVDVAAVDHDVGPGVLGDTTGQDRVGDLDLVVVGHDRKAAGEARRQDGADVPRLGLFRLEGRIAADDQTALVVRQAVLRRLVGGDLGRVQADRRQGGVAGRSGRE